MKLVSSLPHRFLQGKRANKCSGRSAAARSALHHSRESVRRFVSGRILLYITSLKQGEFVDFYFEFMPEFRLWTIQFVQDETRDSATHRPLWLRLVGIKFDLTHRMLVSLGLLYLRF